MYPRLEGVLVTGNFTMAREEALKCKANSGSFTVTLPSAALRKGRPCYFVKSDSTANTVTIQCSGTDKINGASSYVLSAQYDKLVILSDGVDDYYIV